MHGCATSSPRKHPSIFAAAQVLGVHLKRWAGGGLGRLLDNDAVPPEKLQFCDREYLLRSAILHRGTTAKSGHYVAALYHPTDQGCWWFYDDTIRRALRDGDLTGTLGFKSYMCFYEVLQ